jgi:hypothetical protein
LLLFGAGAAKLAEGRDRRRSLIEGYRLLPRRGVLATAALLPWVEISTGLALWTGAWPAVAASAAGVLFVAFGSAVTVNLLRGRTDIDCGCFGSRGSHGLSWWIVVRNAALAAVAVAVAAASGSGAPGLSESLPVALAATALVLAGFVLRTVRKIRRLDFGVAEESDDPGAVTPAPGEPAPSSIKSYLPLTSAEDSNA